MSKINISNLGKQLTYCISLILLIGLVAFNYLVAPAWAEGSSLGKFNLTQACEATTSIKGNNPLAVNAGQVYDAVKLNKDTNPTHVLIKIPDTQERWVPLTCGKLDNFVADSSPEPVILLPFFDTTDNPVLVSFGGNQDITPVAPKLNDFDLAINKLCGVPGTVVTPADFKKTLLEFPDVLSTIKTNVGGYLVAGRTSDDEFLDDLTDIWFNAQGFDHVFCGEPGKGIGGLHYAGRYLDLQEKGLAGLLPNSNEKAEVIPGAVYSVGVVMLVNNRKVISPIKGYTYTLNAEEILAIAAKAYKDNPSTLATPKACLLNITDDGQTFTNVFVTKNGAIRTFYSDATPDFTKEVECNVAS